jgi:hypothetical protein
VLNGVAAVCRSRAIAAFNLERLLTLKVAVNFDVGVVAD